MASSRRVLVLGLSVVAFGALGCPSPETPKPVEGDAAPSKAPSGDSAPAAPPNEQHASPDQQGCRDWSSFDVDTLPELPASDYAATLDEVWRRVLDKHYDPTLGCVDWPAMRAKYAAKLEGVTERSQAYAVINEMLQELEQSHFHLFDPAAAGDEAVGPASPQFQARWIEQALVVVDSDIDAVPPGAEVRAIDGTPFATAIEGARRRSEAGVASFDSLIGRAAAARLSCRSAGDTHKLSIVETGTGRDVEVACKLPQGERISMGNLSNVPTRVEHRVIVAGEGTKVGYLAFNIWMLPMLERVKAALSEMRGQGIQALVLDLRGNPGGVGPMSVPVARLLLQESASLGKLQFRDLAHEFNVAASPQAFDGPVALLVDEGTASTSEIFAVGLRDLGRVKIFGGGPSAGAALPSLIEELEGGAILQYVVGDYHSPKGTVVEGSGIAPDVVVPETREMFAAGKDPVLDTAVEHLAQGKGT